MNSLVYYFEKSSTSVSHSFYWVMSYKFNLIRTVRDIAIFDMLRLNLFELYGSFLKICSVFAVSRAMRTQQNKQNTRDKWNICQAEPQSHSSTTGRSSTPNAQCLTPSLWQRSVCVSDCFALVLRLLLLLPLAFCLGLWLLAGSGNDGQRLGWLRGGGGERL